MALIKNNAFMISEAEVMICKFGDKPVHNLTPADDGVGLIKEVNVTIDSSSIDLQKGIAQITVDSKKTNVSTTITGTAYEYSAENLLRAQGIASGAVTAKRGKLTTALSGGESSLAVESDPIPGEATSAFSDTTGEVQAGATVLIQHPDIPELVFPARVASASTYAADHTIDITGAEIPAGMEFPVGSNVWVVTEMVAGSLDQGDLFSVKIVGTLANYNRPITYLAPKVQMIRGFNISFNESDYGGMPWEMKPLLLAQSELASFRNAEIGSRAPARLILP